MSLSLKSITTSLGEWMAGVGKSTTQLGGVVGSGVLVDASRRLHGVTARIQAEAEARLAKARGDVPAETRSRVVMLFGGLPMKPVLIVVAAGLLTFFVLRKK